MSASMASNNVKTIDLPEQETAFELRFQTPSDGNNVKTNVKIKIAELLNIV